jgi:glycosyltransferase involved in cell wall biosynthesis
MRVSIVTAILNSHEVVRRQIKHYRKIGLPEDVEIVFVDDGSDPPLRSIFEHSGLNLRWFATHNYREWTQPAARNLGVKNARGEYVICTDIDHIISSQVVELARNPGDWDIIRFSRQVAVLDEEGNFTQDMDVLRSYGYNRDGINIAPHGNSYIFNRNLYLRLGGVSEQHVGTGKYPNREEVPLKGRIKELWKKGEIKVWDKPPKPMIYMIPNGHYCGDKDSNPFGMFHELTRSIRVSRRRQAEYARA